LVLPFSTATFLCQAALLFKVTTTENTSETAVAFFNMEARWPLRTQHSQGTCLHTMVVVYIKKAAR
ncbi:hypothetical protein QP786_09335, partial [Gleimia europaea]|nr:hypothetical protein [Gleimia europaea]